MPELVLGIVLVLACALGALLWNRSVTAGRPVVVASGDIRRGDVIDAEDLRAADVRGAGDISFVSGADAASLVGAVALVDLAAGEPLTPSVVSSVPPLRTDEAIASVSIERGQAPTDLAPGDLVRVVVVPVVDPVDPVPPSMLDLAATVWQVDPPTDYDPEVVVALRVPLADAAAVAGADSVRLVRVEP